MARILSGADFGVRFPTGGGVANNNFSTRLSASLLNQAMQNDRQDELTLATNQRNDQIAAQTEKKAQAVSQEKIRLDKSLLGLSRVSNMNTGTIDEQKKKKSMYARFAAEEIENGENPNRFIEAMNTTNFDEFNMILQSQIDDVTATSGRASEALKAMQPQKPLSPEGKLQSDINSGVLTKKQAAAQGTNNASAISEFLPGGGSRKILPDNTEVYTNAVGDVVEGQDRVDLINRSAKFELDKEVASQELRLDSERSIQQIKNAENTSAKAFEAVDKIRMNITNLEKVVPLIGEGANTGPISRMFFSVKAATVKLEQLQKRLSLDVVGAVTFGALSKGELDLAKAVAIPLGLEGDELIQWTNDSIAAKRKLATYYEDQAIFLSNGGTQAGWIQKGRDELNNLFSRSGASESDIETTMEANGLSRPQVLEELRRRFPDGS
jgi:hypothetical protein